jgi:excisionase family DNA binding protein
MKKYLRISEVADRVGLHPHTVRKLAEEGKLPCYRDANGYRRFKLDDVQTFERSYMTKEK